MEIQSLPLHAPPCIGRAEIDTARPFRSVKEAVTIFGERILGAQKSNIATSSNSSTAAAVAAASSSSPPVVATAFSSYSYSPSSSHFKQENEHEHKLIDILQKLEAELEETKRELKSLKERESETEVALASLNAELHKNMSKMAEAEAAAASRAVAKSGEEKKKERGVKSDHSPCLAQILRIGEKEEYFEITKEQRKMMKKKPIIPLIGDMFAKKKSSMSLYNPAPYKHSQAYAS
ncbi:WEB family protein At3g51220 [Magnolia sinica]|uniref:WEB family protein At3g51220 n=1 Tax=Magnolia sinica TaxID=86752 RepID=UPI00265A191F|nr:WEB family protein At3g51220 [Magnolia sinica]